MSRAPMRTHFLVLVLALSAAVATTPVAALEPVMDGDSFTRLVTGRELTRTGIRLQVLPGGRIIGRGLGYQVTGKWRWQNGFFCRSLDWGGSDLGHDCQSVLADDRRVRFVADEGTGEHADFRLR
jgi:hypothetical protein